MVVLVKFSLPPLLFLVIEPAWFIRSLCDGTLSTTKREILSILGLTASVAFIYLFFFYINLLKSSKSNFLTLEELRKRQLDTVNVFYSGLKPISH